MMHVISRNELSSGVMSIKALLKQRELSNLFSQAVIRIRRHARRHVKDDFHSGGSVVRCCKTCAAIPLESTHEATVRSEVHLRSIWDIKRGLAATV